MTISLDDRADILSSVRIGFPLEVAAKGMRTTAAACRDLAATDAGWAADLADAEREGADAARAAHVCRLCGQTGHLATSCLDTSDLAGHVAPDASPRVPPAPTWAELAAMSAAQQEADKVAARPKVDLAKWASATTHEEAAAAVTAVTPARAKGTAADPRTIVPTFAEGEDVPDWERFADEAAAEYGPGRMGLYLKQDARLVQGGMPAATPWWQWTIGEFLASELTWLIAMVGRGAGKSTNLERLLMLIVIWTKRYVPPGQPWTCPFMSAIEADAFRRIKEISALLQIAYHVEGKIRGQSIRVADCCGNQIEIVSTAGTIAQTSGPSTVSAFFDEAAKMRTAAGAANSDTELIASIVGTSRELEGWIGVRCSSAFETRGAHFDNCMEGTNSQNFVATIGPAFIDAALAGYEDVAKWEHAQGNTHGAAQIRSFAKTLTPQSPNVATWVARPTLTAMRSRMKLETLPKDSPELEGLSRFEYWIREYGSMPLSREIGPDLAEQCAMSADITARLTGRRPTPRAEPELMKVAGAPPGDARYPGPKARARVERVGTWRSRKVF